jgi:citrate/tricarballylate utilization protein
MVLFYGRGRLLLGQQGTSASPYGVIPYSDILIFALVPCVWSAIIMARSALSYWSKINGIGRHRINFVSICRTVADAGDLRYLKGGGVGCAYPNEEMSPTRRRMHAATAYGFVALLLSTISAAILQDGFGIYPPYSTLSLPVCLGILGGGSMVLGCTGMVILKGRADPMPSDAQMIARDYGLLIAIDLLGITGLLTLALRHTPAFGIILVIHLSIVMTSFAIMPYTKFMHVIYRLLSILKDNLERGAE